jgi:hypothetical protein
MLPEICADLPQPSTDDWMTGKLPAIAALGMLARGRSMLREICADLPQPSADD